MWQWNKSRQFILNLLPTLPSSFQVGFSNNRLSNFSGRWSRSVKLPWERHLRSQTFCNVVCPHRFHHLGTGVPNSTCSKLEHIFSWTWVLLQRRHSECWVGLEEMQEDGKEVPTKSKGGASRSLLSYFLKFPAIAMQSLSLLPSQIQPYSKDDIIIIMFLSLVNKYNGTGIISTFQQSHKAGNTVPGEALVT